VTRPCQYQVEENGILRLRSCDTVRPLCASILPTCAEVVNTIRSATSYTTGISWTIGEMAQERNYTTATTNYYDNRHCWLHTAGIPGAKMFLPDEVHGRE